MREFLGSVFHVLFLNPPYLQLHGCARSEKRFLGENYDHLMMGGVLIYIIPYYRQIPQFYGEKFNVRELAQQMQRMGSMLPKRSVLDEYGQKKHPPLPLTIGQIGLVGGSGLINGLIECETPHIIKGQVIKSKSSRTGATIEEPEGTTMTEVVETVSNKMIFNLLTSEGIKH